MKFRVGATVILLIVVWAVAAGILVGMGAQKARQGRDDINVAKAHIDATSLSDGTTQRQLAKTAVDMKAAHSRLANPIVQPWRLFPIVGRQISSAIALSNAGEKVATVGSTALTQSNALRDQAKTNRQATLTQLATIAGNASTQLASVKLGPSQHLVKSLATAHDEFATDLISVQQGLERASAGADGAASLFNTNGNYLILAANPSEMRSGSGMLLSAGILTTGNGKISVGDMKDVSNYVVPNTAITWPQQISTNWGFLQDRGKFQDLMLSPQFDVSAPIAQQLWKQSTGQQVDGVMVVDPEMLQSILEATGPVSADGQTFTADNVEHYLLYTQYENLTASQANNLARRDVLSDVATAAFNALDQGNWDPITLAKSLATAANGRHIFLESNDAKVNQDWLTAGVAGTLDSNSLMMSIVNLGGNKLDQFMKADATISDTGSPKTGVGSGYDFTVNVKVTNTAPNSGPSYVFGPFPGSGLKAGEYSGALNFNLPGDSTAISFDGPQTQFLAGPDGPTQAIAIHTDLKSGESANYVLHFHRAPATQFTRVMPSARVNPTSWHFGSTTWVDDHSHFIFP